jgi:SSS family solute:Na+ symporter
MNSAIVIIFVAALGALLLGLRARHGHTMNLEEWSVGGRSFRTVLVFLLLAGEIYTTFSFLGASGFAYGKGGSAYYILAYLTLNQVAGYWILPGIWRASRRERLVSQAHFFVRQYDSPALSLLVALVGLIALVFYLVLQLKGLGIIVGVASYGSISPTVSVWIGAAILVAYVTVSGVRGAVWNAVIKDVLILAIVVFLGIYLPLHYYGGYGAMFTAVERARPGFLAFPATGNGIVWYQSTVIVNALGGYMWPHMFSSIFTARDARISRRNAVVMPLYSLMLLFVFFVGFAATLQVPGLQGDNVDLALLKLTTQTFDPWFVGVIGAAGLLTALVPGSVILTAAATMIANDVYRGTVRRDMSDASVNRLAQYMVTIVTLVGVFFTLKGGTTIVALLLMGYNFIVQFLPAVAFSLRARNPVTKQGAFCGILAGVLVLIALALSGTTLVDLFPFLPEALRDVNAGLIALVLNIAVTGAVSAATQPRAALAALGVR